MSEQNEKKPSAKAQILTLYPSATCERRIISGKWEVKLSPDSMSIANGDNQLQAYRKALKMIEYLKTLPENKKGLGNLFLPPVKKIRKKKTTPVKYPRFEEGFAIQHCGIEARRLGNLSLREAGARVTAIAYECPKCYLRFVLSEDWGPSMATIAEIDATP